LHRISHKEELLVQIQELISIANFFSLLCKEVTGFCGRGDELAERRRKRESQTPLEAVGPVGGDE
jgi:hypothetical protein